MALYAAPVDLFKDVEEIKRKCSAMSRSCDGESEEGGTGKMGPTLIAKLKGHSSDVTSVDFAGRSLLATGSSDKSVRVYKWQAGDKFSEVAYSPLVGHRYGINCVVFSPFGTKLASASTDGLAIIWDVKTGDRLCKLQVSSEAAVRVCAFSSNSALLATGGDDDHASVWDVSTLTLLRRLNEHESTVTSLSFTPDNNYLMTGSSGAELKLWDARFGHAHSLATRVEVHDLGVSALHFSPAIGKDDCSSIGKQYLLASGGQDNNLCLWSVEIGSGVLMGGGSSGPSINHHRTLQGHKGPIMAVRFSSNGLVLASASGDKTVRLWDPMHGVALSELDGHSRYVTSCAFSDDGALVAAGSGDRYVLVWRIEDPNNPSSLSKNTKLTSSAKSFMRYSSQKWRENKKLIDWTCDDVCGWLVDQGMAEYSHNFRAHAIDGRELMAVSDEVLEHTLGVDAMGHRNKVLRLVRRFTREGSQLSFGSPSSPPVEFLCPITQELIKDPVLCADGFTYERVALEAWLASGKRTSPMTNEKLSHLTLTPNRTLRTLIQRYREEND